MGQYAICFIIIIICIVFGFPILMMWLTSDKKSKNDRERKRKEFVKLCFSKEVTDANKKTREEFEKIKDKRHIVMITTTSNAKYYSNEFEPIYYARKATDDFMFREYVFDMFYSSEERARDLLSRIHVSFTDKNGVVVLAPHIKTARIVEVKEKKK